MRNLKAKPAVSTLKTVHTNYFPVGVSTLLSVCCQQTPWFDCRSVLASSPPANVQHPISILICSRTVIKACFLFKCKIWHNPERVCSRDTEMQTKDPHEGRLHTLLWPNWLLWRVYLRDALRVITTHWYHARFSATPVWALTPPCVWFFSFFSTFSLFIPVSISHALVALLPDSLLFYSNHSPSFQHPSSPWMPPCPPPPPPVRPSEVMNQGQCLCGAR